MRIVRNRLVLLTVFIVVASIAVIGILLREPAAHAASTSSPIQITWLLPHNNINNGTELFSNSIRVFGQELQSGTNGHMKLVKTLTPGELGFQPGDHATMVALDTGTVNLISQYTAHLAGMGDDTALYALELPYLFDDYDSALRFLDGPKGQQLLDSITASTPYHALAFTMSGGFRIFASKEKKIERPSDLKGMRIAHINGDPVQSATFDALGAISVISPNLDGGTPTSQELQHVDAVEFTYTNIGPLFSVAPEFKKYVTETNHDMNLSVMMVTNSFYHSLTPVEQAALVQAAHDAGVIEKKDSIAMTTSGRALIQKMGGTVVILTPGQIDAFKTALQPVRDTFDPEYSWVLNLIASSH